MNTTRFDSRGQGSDGLQAGRSVASLGLLDNGGAVRAATSAVRSVEPLSATMISCKDTWRDRIEHLTDYRFFVESRYDQRGLHPLH